MSGTCSECQSRTVGFVEFCLEPKNPMSPARHIRLQKDRVVTGVAGRSGGFIGAVIARKVSLRKRPDWCHIL